MSLLWPPRPTCHDDPDTWPPPSRPPVWNPVPADANEGHPYVACSYCGSCHPGDLHAALLGGARLERADWKYGWPHKFYVHGFPNPQVGKLRQISYTMSGDGVKRDIIERPEPPTTTVKWYNEHLRDLEPTAFAALAELLAKQTGVFFETDAGRLGYRCPR